jgi:transcriptional regulator with XRE-family HTH domain
MGYRSIPFGIFLQNTFGGMPVFGSKLKALREGKGWTQKQLAAAAGVSQNGISHWENGDRTPTWDVVIKLCRAFGEPCTVFDETETAGPEPEPAPPAPKPKRKK